jgi:hypothetical protein
VSTRSPRTGDGRERRTYVLEAPLSGAVPLAFVEGVIEQPFSVGRKGDWRIDGQGVLDVHAFVFFDGQKVLACSSDTSSAAELDGKALPKTWTPLPVPCRLSFGGVTATLRPESEQETPDLQPADPTRSKRQDSEETMMGAPRPRRSASEAPAPRAPPVPAVPAAPAAPASPAPASPAPVKGSRTRSRLLAVAALVASLGIGVFVHYERQRPLVPPPVDPLPVAFPDVDDASAGPTGVVVYPAPPILDASVAKRPTQGDAGPSLSLERIAVDALHRGDLEAAAAAYETLAAQHPENPAYARAARTLRK